MELIFSSISLVLSLILFMFVVTNHFKKNIKSSTTRDSKVPPGPWKIPIIGNIHQLVGPLPHHTLRNLAKKYGPLMLLQLGEIPTFLISSPEVAKQVLKDNDVNFAQRPYLLASRILSYDSTNIIFSPYGDYWRQMRKICVMELLSSKRVQSFQAIREDEVMKMIKSISQDRLGSPINISEKVFSLTYGITGRAAFGRKNNAQAEFIKIIEEALVLGTGFSIADLYPSIKILQSISGMRRKLEKLQKRLDLILDNIVCEHRGRISTNAETEDLVDVLLRIQKQGGLEFPLTDDNIKAVIFDIFSAGSETSSTVVEWALSELLKNPKKMERAQAEVRNIFNEKGNMDETVTNEHKYIKSIIKETLRLHPSAPLLIPKESTEECQINGYTIPAKSKVFVNAWAIGRDPNHWVEPDTFHPERFLESEIDFRGSDFEYIPFGAGRRICPGILFALPNVELPLAQLLYHFNWKLPNNMEPGELDMEEAFGVTVKRKNALILVPTPYNH